MYTEKEKIICLKHCAKSVRIRSFSGPYFPVFGLNTERHGVSECGKYRAEKLRIRTLFTQRNRC